MRPSRFAQALLAPSAVAAAMLGACDRLHVRAAPNTLAIALPAPPAAKDAQSRWRPFLVDMQAQTGLKVEPLFEPSARPAIEALASGRAQAGLFGDAAGLLAVRRADGEVVAAAAPAAARDGNAAVIVVRARSPNGLDQILRCGRRLSYGSGEAGSVAGVLAPMTWLFEPHGVSPSACFRAVREGETEANLVAVAVGGLDAAAGDTATLRRIAADRPALARELRVVWTSPKLPADPVVWRRDLDPSVKEKLRAFLMGYGQAPGTDGARQRAVLAGLGFARFQPADDALLLPMREMEAAEALLKAREGRDPAAARRAEAALARVRREEAAAAKAAG